MTKSLSGRLGAKLCSPHSLQHLLDLAFGLRELLCIVGAQHHIRVGPLLWIEERIAELDVDLGARPVKSNGTRRAACITSASSLSVSAIGLTSPALTAAQAARARQRSRRPSSPTARPA